MRSTRSTHTRRLALTPGLLSAALLGMATLGGANGLDDWPTFLGPDQNAKSTEPLGLPWPAAGPPVRWSVKLHDTYAAPTVAGGGVFVNDRVGDVVRLSRLDPNNGKVVWSSEAPTDYVDQFDFGEGPRAAPVYDAGEPGAEGPRALNRVYTLGADGRLRGQNAENGDVLWEVMTNDRFGVVQNFFGAASTPVIYGDLLLVNVGGSPPGDWDNHTKQVEPNGTGIVAFDKLSGDVVYRNLRDLASYASLTVRKLAGKERLIAFARSGLWVLDPATGKVLGEAPWRAERAYSVNAATPVVVGDEIFVTESYERGGALFRWKEDAPNAKARLEPIWSDAERRRRQSMAAHWNTPIFHQGFLYGSHGEKSGSAELRCVEWATGEVRWKHRGLRRSNALYADGHLVVLGEYGELVVVRATPEAYREVGRYALEDRSGGDPVPMLRHPAWNAPVLSDGVLYLAGADRLVALDLPVD